MRVGSGQTGRCQEGDDGFADDPGFRYATSGLRSLRMPIEPCGFIDRLRAGIERTPPAASNVVARIRLMPLSRLVQHEADLPVDRVKPRNQPARKAVVLVESQAPKKPIHAFLAER